MLTGVTVTALHVETGLRRSATTDCPGQLCPGRAPRRRLRGARGARRLPPCRPEGRRAHRGGERHPRLTLDLGAATEEVTIEADLSGVQTRSGELSYLVAEESIQRLPLNGRNYTDLALLQPGVIAFPHRDSGSVVAHGVGASVNGQDPRANVYLLDGTLMNDFTNGPAGSAAGTTLGLEMVREFRVEANAYGAEYGRNAGGQITVVTKSGTNDLRGRAWSSTGTMPSTRAITSTPARSPTSVRKPFGFALGGRSAGPDLLLGYEGLRANLGRTISTGGAGPGRAPRDHPRSHTPADDHRAHHARRAPLPHAIPAPPGTPWAAASPRSRSPSAEGGPGLLPGAPGRSLGERASSSSDNLRTRGPAAPHGLPAVPADFISQNQFATAEYRRTLSARSLGTVRWVEPHPHRPNVEADTGPPPFVSGRPSVRHRHRRRSALRPAELGGLRLRQDVFSLARPHPQPRPAPPEAGSSPSAIATASSTRPSPGHLHLPNWRLSSQPAAEVHRDHPDGDLERSWDFSLIGLYLQYDFTWPQPHAERGLALRAVHAPGGRPRVATSTCRPLGGEVTVGRSTSAGPGTPFRRGCFAGT